MVEEKEATRPTAGLSTAQTITVCAGRDDNRYLPLRKQLLVAGVLHEEVDAVPAVDLDGCGEIELRHPGSRLELRWWRCIGRGCRFPASTAWQTSQSRRG